MNARMIDHEEAVKSLMAERYLLGELNAAEREAYEEHMFSCDACFDQVKAGTEFVSHLRRIGVEEAAATLSQPAWPRMLRNAFRPGPALAFAVVSLCIAIFSAHQALVIRQLKAPETVTVFTLTPASRAANKVITAPRNGSFELRVVFQPKAEFTTYEAQVISAGGKSFARIPVRAPQTDELQVRLNAENLNDGNYVLVIQATDATGHLSMVNQYPFALRLQD